MADSDRIEAFLNRWSGVTGSERANHQLFVTELCTLLGLPQPDPARDDTRDNAYVFERSITFAHGDGSHTPGYIDCYRRGAFVLEAKKIKAASHTKGFDDALLRARAQAEGYARALPASEGRPPFVVVVDVGHVIELYAEFTRSGATYTPFPDTRSHRLKLADLRDPAARDRLRLLWLDPMALDPARASAKVTREVAAKLAALARDLEAAGHGAHAVAAFLTRCLFCMFAEDVGLLPKAEDGRGAFLALVRRHRDDPGTLRQMLRVLWMDMDRGGFSPALARPVLHFNGKLFKGHAEDDYVLPLSRAHIDGLLDAATSNWREVEPAIFGTLLERALDPDERHALGAHYTPRAYVERLVLPTVVEPLRADWADAQAAALLLATEANALEGKKRDDKLAEARAEVRRFHHQLCTTRVLDPACGSGNFLYVTLEHLKRLEAEVLAQLDALGETQGRLGFAGETVTPQQLLGIEVNERAAALAELVLWIGFLQWHIRSFGDTSVAEPVIHDYGNIECRDAVLAWDGQEPMRDEAGNLVTRWDGKTFKIHPVTGERVPDDKALVPQWRYLNPRAAEWPQADFIVGNPPFIGARRMRPTLGDGYIEALRRANPDVADTADLVCYWWNRSAGAVSAGTARRFGLITTNSIVQAYSRPVLDKHIGDDGKIALVFAIADHPWVLDGAAVRVAITVGELRSAGSFAVIAQAISDAETGLAESVSGRVVQRIGSALQEEAAPRQITRLGANAGMCFQGVVPAGAGFKLEANELLKLGEKDETLSPYVRRYTIGKDLVQVPERRFIIDFFGLDEDEARIRHPAGFQRLFDSVKPERELNPRQAYRERWWLFAEARPAMRAALAGLHRFIATPYTAKHRPFVFMPADFIPDAMVYAIASQDGLHLGALASVVHETWCARFGGTLEDRPRYNSKATFLPFPFPSDDTGLTPELTTRIRDLAEQLDAHRKARQAAHPDLTLTGMYNVLDKLRRAEPLTAKDKTIHALGLVSVLKSLHDDLDTAVLQAYGWADLQAALADHTHTEARAAAVETLLERLVALNARRAAEEAGGLIRWLRPDFQQRGAAVQQRMDVDAEETEAAAPEAAPPVAAHKRPWPAGLPEQIKAVAEVLAGSPSALSLADIEQRFSARGRWRDRLPTIVETLEALGRVRRLPGEQGRWQAG